METWSPCHKLLGGLAAAFLAKRIAMGRSEALERPWLNVGWKRGTLVPSYHRAPGRGPHCASWAAVAAGFSCSVKLRDTKEAAWCRSRRQSLAGRSVGGPTACEAGVYVNDR
eukprot:804486-Prymnesium_polylepis.1